MVNPGTAMEKRRRQVLRRYDRTELDHAALEHICNLARALFRVPIAAVTLVDENRFRIAAISGMEANEAPVFAPHETVCIHAVRRDGTTVIGDLREDARFSESKLVNAEPFARFYAGAPLTIEPGASLGMLCILDTVPRELAPRERDLLSGLAALVADQVKLRQSDGEARAALKRRQKSDRRLKDKANALNFRETLLARTERAAQTGSWEWDVQRRRLRWSDEIYHIHGLEPGRAVSLSEAQAFFDEEARSRLSRAWSEAIASQRPFDLQLGFKTANGCRRWSRTSGEAETRDGRTVRLFGTFQDTTELKQAQERFERAANQDPLTGLLNRRLFRERLEREIETATHKNSALSLILIDIDNFREVNDTLGSDAGDAVLVAVARRLNQAVRPSDMVARLGGDEFAVMLNGRGRSERPPDPAAALLALLAEPVVHGGETIHVSACAGLANFPSDETEAAQLFKDADMALNRAKTLGRGRSCSFVPALKEAVESRRRVVTEVREAIARDEIVLYYQPKVDLSRRRVIGFEALARWQHPRRGLLTPSAFQAAFEDPGVAGILGETVLQRALADISRFTRDGVPFGSVAVNVAAEQFRHGDFAEHVATALADWGVPADRLEIEVTESVFLDRGAEMVGEALRALHRMGVVIAFDDFGTGFASLTHLKRFPVDVLKIDQTFVRDIQRDPDDAAIVRAVISMGRSLGIITVAEGVETQEQLDYLRQCGCDQGQGYLFSRPIPASIVPGFLARFEAGVAPLMDIE